MKTRTHRADRTAQRRRRVHIAEFLKIAEDDGFAIPHRQRDDRPPERFEMTPAIKIADGIDFNRQLRGSGLRFVVERQRRPDRARAAHVIAGDAEQPELRRRPSRPIARTRCRSRRQTLRGRCPRQRRSSRTCARQTGRCRRDDGGRARRTLRDRLRQFERSAGRRVARVRPHPYSIRGRERFPPRPQLVGSAQGWNFFGSILVLTRKRSKVVSSTVSAPSARRSRKGHFMPSTSR